MSKICSNHNLSVLEELCNELKINTCLLRISTNYDPNSIEQELYSDQLDALVFRALNYFEDLTFDFETFFDCLHKEIDMNCEKDR